MKLRKLFTIALILFLASDAGAASLMLLAPPTGERTSLSRLTMDDKGRLHLSWIRSSGKLSSLYHANLTDNKWSRATLISEGEDWFVNWADFPFLSVDDTGMATHWLKKSSGGTYDYDVVATFYSTITQRWSKPAIIHKDGVSAEHGFVSMLSLGEGRTFISWLDGRNTHQDKSDSNLHATRGMTLRGGVFNSEGKTLEDWELDGLVCDCCQTSAAMTDSGPVVVYRNRTDDEIRDIYITRMSNGRWSTPVAVYNDNWQVAGCPVNGPSISSRRGLTAVAWFTAQDDRPKVSFVLSLDDGKTFGKAIVVAEETTNGRVSIAVLDSGDIAISWLETNGTAAQIKLARYDHWGKLKESLTIADSKSSRRSGFPVIIGHGDDVYVTWTEVSGQPQVKVARVEF